MVSENNKWCSSWLAVNLTSISVSLPRVRSLGSAQRGPFPHTGSTGVAVGVRKKAISCGEEKVDAKLTSSRRQVVAARSQRAASTWGTKVDTPRRLGKLTRRVGLKLASSRREVDAKLTSSRRQVDVKSTRGRFSAPKKPFFSIFRNPLLIEVQ